MTKAHSTAPPRKRKPGKPAKPHKDFPLFAHANGQWAKKVLGKMYFFGVWAKPQEALELWLAEKDARLAGREPRDTRSRHPHDTPALHDLVNQFLTTKQRMMDAGELSIHTWNGYDLVCKELIAAFKRDRLLTDILPEDFEALRSKWAAKWGVVRLGSEINRARVVFNYAYKNGLIDRPMRYGEGFRRPSRKSLRLSRAEKGPKMFEADELRRMIDTAAQPMKAMILLGINCAFGNNDVGQLPMKAMNLKTGWIDYPRPKTGVARRCPLWPETIAAVKDWLSNRPTPKDDADAEIVFVTRCGARWTKATADRPITKECRKLLDELKIGGNRNFYAIRHTFETIAGEAKDQIAVDAVMGHDDGSMATAYRERISDSRLQAVTDFVRKWLFNKTQ